MDTKTRETLELIQLALKEMLEDKQISLNEYCMQMILVAYDFVYDEDYVAAIQVTEKIDPDFLRNIGNITGVSSDIFKAKRVYKELGIEFCIPKLSGEDN